MNILRDIRHPSIIITLMHDIGKIAVPDAILRKEGKLNDTEWHEMKTHPISTANVLKDFDSLKEIIPWALYHHERFDGKGYPEGKSGTNIPLPAQIIAIADAFDAMTSARPYRPAMPTEQMHTAELFHTSIHEMLILAGNYVEKPDNIFKRDYDNYSAKANGALQKLKRQTISTENMNDHRSAKDKEFCIECVENITSRFVSLQEQLNAVFISKGDERMLRLKKAKEIFDDIFHNYYIKLHTEHQKQFTDVKQKSHQVKTTMDIYFIAQLVFALLSGALVLFYFDRTVLKLYAVTEHLTITDPLTSLYNRQYLKRYLEDEVDISIRYNRPFSIAMIDIDNFKRYNDTYGHPAGDKLLKDLSSLLKKSVRKTDRVIRYGGEELLIIFPETPKPTAVEVAEKIRSEIELHPFMLPDKHHSPSVTVSIGVAAFPEDGYSGETVIKKADDVLYKAKNEGKNRVNAS